jgi:hypothetical protein
VVERHSRKRIAQEAQDSGVPGMGRISLPTMGSWGVELSGDYALRFRYARYTPRNGCPRCGGALFDSMCIMCGWDGPTRAPSPAERREYTERLRTGVRRPRAPKRAVPTPAAGTSHRPTHKYGGVVYRALSLKAVRRG